MAPTTTALQNSGQHTHISIYQTSFSIFLRRTVCNSTRVGDPEASQACSIDRRLRGETDALVDLRGGRGGGLCSKPRVHVGEVVEEWDRAGGRANVNWGSQDTLVVVRGAWGAM